MNDKEKQNRFIHEALMIMGILALLCLVCRLWPILLLIVLGALIAAIRMVFLSAQKVEIEESMPELQKAPTKEPTETDVKQLAYSVILKRITERIVSEYPEARWVWEAPNAKELIDSGDDVFVLLNRAGGYRRARINIHNLQVTGIVYETISAIGNAMPEADELKQSEESKADELKQSEENETDELSEENEKESYQLLAFEWVEAHIFELNARCNEAIGQNLSELVISADELPTKESWADICDELGRAGLENVHCVTEGIKINLTQ